MFLWQCLLAQFKIKFQTFNVSSPRKPSKSSCCWKSIDIIVIIQLFTAQVTNTHPRHNGWHTSSDLSSSDESSNPINAIKLPFTLQHSPLRYWVTVRKEKLLGWCRFVGFRKQNVWIILRQRFCLMRHNRLIFVA